MQLGSITHDATALRGERALRFLAEASARLNRSLDVEETLGEITRMAVPWLADWCTLELGSDPRTSRQLAVAHVDPAKVQYARDLRAKFPPDPNAPNGVPQVLRTGEPEFVPQIPPQAFDVLPKEQADIARSLGLKSYIVVPLKVRDRVLGALTLVTAESNRTLEKADLDLATDLAGRAATALDNARLYAEAREAEQRSRLALEAGRLGTWEWNIAGQKIHWSPAIERMHGIPEGSFDGTFEMYQSDIHPDDKARVLGSVSKLLESGETNHHLLYRIVRPDGGVRWLEAFGTLTRDATGKPLVLRGVCGDVTDRIEREEQIRAANERTKASELRYRQILDSVQDMVFTKDKNLTVVYANKATCDYYGMTAEQLRGVTDVPFNQRDFTQKYNRDDLAVFETGKTVEDPDEQNKNAKGEVRIMHVVKSPVRDAAGNIVELVGVARDVTEKRAAEARQRQLEEDQRAAEQQRVRAAVVEALASDRDDHTVLQQAAEALQAGLKLERVIIWMVQPGTGELQAAAHAGAAPPKRLRLVAGEGFLGKVLAGRVPYRCDEPSADPHAAELQIPAAARMFALFPLVVGDEPFGILSFSSASSGDSNYSALALLADTVAQAMARRRAQGQLAAFARDLERSNADLQQFAYVASHDLQEPLRMVASYVQLLERRYKGRLDGDADDFIRFAVEGTRRMQSLINDLLTFSRVGTRAQALKPVELDEVVRASLDNLANAVERNEAKVVVQPRLPRVWGDASQLVQVLQNLVSNALKFKNGPPVVEVSAEQKGGFVEVTVKDNGIGIDPQYFERVFVIFQRLHTRQEFEGNGIGLAICKKIIERHGGRIWIDSQPGQGSAFHFTLPTEGEKARAA